MEADLSMNGLSGVRVLFICGWGRSGSTFVGNALGEVDGVFNAGELRGLWQHWDRGYTRCGCGLLDRECRFWQEVWAELLRRYGQPIDPAEISALQRRHVRTRPRNLWYISRSARAGSALRSLAPYPQLLVHLYAAIATVTGARTIVDTSKAPAHAYLAALSGIDVRILHLVRDPRAVAHAWKRRPIEGVTFSPAESSMHWLGNNLATEVLHRRHPEIPYLLLRYEDFAHEPQAVLRETLSLIDASEHCLPFVGPTAVQLSTNHTVGGNPSRFITGVVEIRPDEAWRHEMSLPARLLASVPAVPVMRRYGYAFAPRAAARL